MPSGPPGPRLTLPFQLSTLGDAYTQAGRFDEAHETLDGGWPLREERRPLPRGRAAPPQGELLLAESPDQAAAAEDCFRQAIETARRQQSRGGSCGPRRASPGSGNGRAAATRPLHARWRPFTPGTRKVHEPGLVEAGVAAGNLGLTSSECTGPRFLRYTRSQIIFPQGLGSRPRLFVLIGELFLDEIIGSPSKVDGPVSRCAEVESHFAQGA